MTAVTKAPSGVLSVEKTSALAEFSVLDMMIQVPAPTAVMSTADPPLEVDTLNVSVVAEII